MPGTEANISDPPPGSAAMTKTDSFTAVDAQPGPSSTMSSRRPGPVIGICNTWSELTPCNDISRTLAEKVKHGVWEAGGLASEFPVMSTTR